MMKAAINRRGERAAQRKSASADGLVEQVADRLLPAGGSG